MSSWELIGMLRLLSGFCVGGVMVISNIYISEIWPVKTRGIFIGFLSIGFPIGIISAGLTDYLFYSWRTGFMIGLIPMCIALLSFTIIKESARENEYEKKLGFIPSLNRVFNDNHKYLIKGSILFGSMLIGMWAIFSWLPTWAQSILVNSDGQKERSLCMMLLGLGGLSGGFFSGWVSRAFGLRKSMMICFLGCMITAYIMFGLNKTFSELIYIETAILAVFFGISQGLLSTYIPQLFIPSIRGTATGFCYNTGRVFTAAAVFFVGALVSVFGGYSNTLLVFSAVFLFGLLIIYFSTDLKLKSI
jgi:MFS family permease